MSRIVAGVADLRLPPEREDGPDPFKLTEQIREYEGNAAGMPALEVTRGAGGELMINDGVTRAARLYWSDPGATVLVDVIQETEYDFTGLPRIRDVVITR